MPLELTYLVGAVGGRKGYKNMNRGVPHDLLHRIFTPRHTFCNISVMVYEYCIEDERDYDIEKFVLNGVV